jgi:UDP-4-amino-4-deoxy-L-arabinose formyltransferase/UDP-glucuronic acid dehydrogenase (UDP-4-keto-hexauronic acid decarboxylating)
MGPKLDSLNTAKEGSSRLVTQFAWDLFNGEPLKLVDGGSQRRCFCDVEDALDGLMSVLRNEKGLADGKIFNIGNPANDYSVKEIAEMMVEIWKDHPFRMERGTPLSQIVETSSGSFYGKGYQDVLARTPSIRRMEETFGFKPVIGIREALRKAIDFFVEEHKAVEKYWVRSFINGQT